MGAIYRVRLTDIVNLHWARLSGIKPRRTAFLPIVRTLGINISMDFHEILLAQIQATGLFDKLIMAVTGHTSRASVVRYAGAARQKARAQVAQDARREGGTKRET